MKNYILVLSIIGLITSCGPSEKQQNQMRDLVAEWKNTSVKAISLAQEIGDKHYLFQAKKTEGDTTQKVGISLGGNTTNCEAALEKMRADIDQFIESWQLKSQQVDELTNGMSVGKWTEDDQEALNALDLEVKQRDVEVEQWLKELKEINEKCDIQSDVIEITEIEN